MSTVINLTPHAIHLLDASDVIVATFEPSGTVARVMEETSVIGQVVVNGIPVDRVVTIYGDVYNMPEEAGEDTYYLVSALVVQAAIRLGLPTHDLIMPTDTVRDDRGRVIGCRRFAAALQG